MGARSGKSSRVAKTYGGLDSAGGLSPGKRTRVAARYAHAVQQKGGGETPAAQTRALAADGVSGASGALPFLDQIQASFGTHDVGGVQAHTDDAAAEASEAMGARAFAVGNSVAFGGAPDLHTAAHEAAHVVQQRGGVQLKGGVGQQGDRYEQQADAVADRVVRGESAQDLLDEAAESTQGAVGAASVQKKENEFASFADQRTTGGVELDPRTGLQPQQERVLEKFAMMINAALATWEQQRGTPDLIFKQTQMVAIAFDQFRASTATMQRHHDLLWREAARRLSVGTNKATVKEIRMFNPAMLGDLKRMLGVEDVPPSHNFEFKPVWKPFTGAGYSGNGVKAGFVSKRITVRYTNTVIEGLSWTQEVNLEGVQLGIGFSTGGTDGKVGGSAGAPGGDWTGLAAPRRQYLPPSFFDGADFTSPSAAVSANLGPAAIKKSLGSALLIRKGSNELLWDMPGNTNLLDFDVEASMEVGAGGSNPISEIHEKGLVPGGGAEAVNEFGETSLEGEATFTKGKWGELEREDDSSETWVPLHFARIFFDTGSALLLENDIATIDKVVQAILAWDKKPKYRGSIFKVDISGCHSDQWSEHDGALQEFDEKALAGKTTKTDLEREERIEREKREKNQALAQDRAKWVHQFFNMKLGFKKNSLIYGVMGKSKVEEPTTHEPLGNPYTDLDTDRSVTIMVSYKIFSKNGQVNLNSDWR